MSSIKQVNANFDTRSAPKDVKIKVKQLRNILDSKYKEADIYSALMENDYDVNKAAAALIDGRTSTWVSVNKKTTRRNTGGRRQGTRPAQTNASRPQRGGKPNPRRSQGKNNNNNNSNNKQQNKYNNKQGGTRKPRKNEEGKPQTEQKQENEVAEITNTAGSETNANNANNASKANRPPKANKQAKANRPAREANKGKRGGKQDARAAKAAGDKDAKSNAPVQGSYLDALNFKPEHPKKEKKEPQPQKVQKKQKKQKKVEKTVEETKPVEEKEAEKPAKQTKPKRQRRKREQPKKQEEQEQVPASSFTPEVEEPAQLEASSTKTETESAQSTPKQTAPPQQQEVQYKEESRPAVQSAKLEQTSDLVMPNGFNKSNGGVQFGSLGSSWHSSPATEETSSHTSEQNTWDNQNNNSWDMSRNNKQEQSVPVQNNQISQQQQTMQPQMQQFQGTIPQQNMGFFPPQMMTQPQFQGQGGNQVNPNAQNYAQFQYPYWMYPSFIPHHQQYVQQENASKINKKNAVPKNQSTQQPNMVQYPMYGGYANNAYPSYETYNMGGNDQQKKSMKEGSMNYNQNRYLGRQYYPTNQMLPNAGFNNYMPQSGPSNQKHDSSSQGGY